MLTKRLVVGVVLLVVMAIPLTGVSAKGIFTQVVISGESIDEPITVTDGAVLEAFAMHTFAAMLEPLEEAQQVGHGYTITRGYYTDGSVFVAFDEATYYPNTNGELGYLFYDGLVNGGSEFDGRWYRMTAQGERAMRQIIGTYRFEHAPRWMQGVVGLVVELNTRGIGHGQALEYWWTR